MTDELQLNILSKEELTEQSVQLAEQARIIAELQAKLNKKLH